MGQDFIPNHLLPEIDFATTHIWPDNWKEMEGGTAVWLRTHALVAAEQLGKPLLVEEFGKKVPPGANAAVIKELRDPVFRSVYSSVEKSVMRQARTCCHSRHLASETRPNHLVSSDAHRGIHL